MWSLRILLVIWVDPLLLLNISLKSLSLHVVLCHLSETLLHGSITEDLLSSDDLLLESICLILFGLLLFHHFSFTHLHLPLEIHLILLGLSESLEVVWLHSVGCEHRHLSGWVLSHEIGVIGILNLSCLSISPLLVLSDLSILLLLGENLVNSQGLLGSLSS